MKLVFFNAVFLLSLVSAQAQGIFKNLNFESAVNLPPSQNGTAFIPITNGLPGWTGYIGGVQTDQIAYNGLSAGSALITLVTTNSANNANGVIDGNYTATLDAGENGPSASIAQTGNVPANAQSLMFKAAGNVIGFLTVSLGGQSLALAPLGTGPNYTLYGADISAFAGLSEQLQFTENPTAANHFGIALLDDISFSTTVVPEPSSFTVFSCGAGLVALFTRKMKSR